ncbi:MAG: hypothetical protein ACRD2Q_09030 [Terriglobales bacterium]
MLSFLLSVVFSVVPLRCRRRYLADPDLNVQRGALFSGIVETVGCALVLWLRYPPYVRGRMAEAAAAVAKAGGDRISEAVSDFATGGLSLFEYIVQPVSLLLVFFVLEGMVRLTAAVVTGEVLPSLPLQFIAWAHGLGEGWKQEHDLGPRIVDTVAPGDAADHALRIESCRPKPWNSLTTISYDGQLYELVRELTGHPPRRFVYLLRKAPESKLVRGLHHYSPDETLQKP